MRRTMFVAMVMLLVVAGAAPAAARDVVNSSGSMVQLWGNWSSYDDETGVYFDAGIYATESRNETLLEYWWSRATPIDCEGDGTGYQYESFWGSGPATLDYARQYTSGEAAGTVTGWMYSYTECWVDGEMVFPENGGGEPTVTVEVSTQFTSTSPLIRQRSSGSFKIPGEQNSHESYSSVFRSGDLVTDVDGETFQGYGQLGKVSWKSHSNSK